MLNQNDQIVSKFKPCKTFHPNICQKVLTIKSFGKLKPKNMNIIFLTIDLKDTFWEDNYKLAYQTVLRKCYYGSQKGYF